MKCVKHEMSKTHDMSKSKCNVKTHEMSRTYENNKIV